MSQVVPSFKLVKSFIAGAVFGLVAYAIYMWPGMDIGCYQWLARDEPLTTAIGSIFFPVQYLIFCFGDHWDFSNVTTMAVLFTMVAVFYGYIFMSIRLYPWVAFSTFGISIFLYFFLIAAFPDSRWRILKLLLWHIALLGHAFAVSDFPIRPVRILIYCFTQGIWYTGLVCGICTFFRPLKMGHSKPAKSNSSPNNLTPTSESFAYHCPNCKRPLAAAVTGFVQHLSCPLCSFGFDIPPLGQPEGPASNAAMTLPLTESSGLQALHPSEEIKAICPGWYVGTCRNDTVGMSANLLMIVFETMGNNLHGELLLSGDLSGGGAFQGISNGPSFSFKTHVPELQVVIEWQASLADGKITGTYTLNSENEELKSASLQFQKGTWSCLFVRGSEETVQGKMNDIWIFDDGLIQGPLTREQFDQGIAKGLWPDKAIVATDDLTHWTTLAICLVPPQP